VRSLSFPARFLAVAGCLLVAATGCNGSSEHTPTYALVQMNLCLSGIASCYPQVAYPEGVAEATSVIRRTQPDAVTLSEACRGDVSQIAQQTGYHMQFSSVLYRGALLNCAHPGGRGLFGNAVLTRAAIVKTENRPFAMQSGIEQRRWLCVATQAGVDVCTAHLNSRSPAEAAGNAGQCTELAAILARLGAAHHVVFGGDLNRRSSCAPAGFWRRTDASASQDPGSQQVFGNDNLHPASVHVLPFAHSDHDVLVVRMKE
jgi:endonuclease/exonuclease/phosphatase family metal-dependent hydrolase